MRVRDIMQSAARISSSTTVSAAAALMDKMDIGSVLIEEYGHVIGIMTERDILSKVVVQSRNADKLKVKSIMSSQIITIDANEDVLEASKVMEQKRVKSLVVTEKGEIIGKITASGISNNLRYGLISGSLHDHNDYLIR